VVAGVGGCLFLVHALRWLTTTTASLTFVFGTLLPLVLAGALTGAGIWLVQSDLERRFVRRTAIWCGAGVLAMSAVGGFTVLLEGSQLRTADMLAVVADTATGGAVVGLIVGIYDVQSRRSAEQLQLERERKARMGQRLRVLNRVLRHDIRNDLNVIAGYAELLERQSADPTTVAAEIKEKSEDIIELSEDAREIENAVRRDDSDVVPIDIVRVLRTQIDRIERDYVGVEVTADLPETQHVYASRLVGSALDNVLENAIEHNDAAAAELTVTLDTVEDGVEYAEVVVADNGPGIPTHEMEVLERGEETRLHHSSGLGLWLINWIVTESRGEVLFEENEPRGSVVRLRFPTSQPTTEPRREEPQPVQAE
jgi:signal transduction histidine kinase